MAKSAGIPTREELGSGFSPINAYALSHILDEYDLNLRANTKLADVPRDCAVVVSNGREERLVFDTIVLSLGTRVDTETINRLKPGIAECYVVSNGNRKSGTVWNAVTSSYSTAMAV